MHRVCVVFIVGLLLIGCSGEDTVVTPINNVPTIVFATSKLVVRKAWDYNLSVDVSDEDADDQLTVTWSITSGTLTTQNAENTIMKWATPSTVGVDTVIVTVSDGKASASVEEVIMRGTYSSTPFAPTEYIAADSPYIIAPINNPPSLLVSGGATTTIQAGVEFYIDLPATFIDVLGTLRANGSVSDPVIIRANNRNLRCGEGRGWWDGIQARSEDAFVGIIDLTHTEIRSADHNVRLIGAAEATLQDCKIVCAKRAGVRITGTGRLIINDCEISDNEQYGVEVSSVSSIPAAVSITGCEITFNNEGIHLELPDLLQTLMTDISYNLIKDNWINGISLASEAFANIHHNYISRNNWSTTSNIRLMSGYPGGADVDTLYATHNYWGGVYTSPGPIEATIWDSADYGSIDTRIKITPWLDASPLP